jgi:hypothetical protein
MTSTTFLKRRADPQRCLRPQSGGERKYAALSEGQQRLRTLGSTRPNIVTSRRERSMQYAGSGHDQQGLDIPISQGTNARRRGIRTQDRATRMGWGTPSARTLSEVFSSRNLTWRQVKQAGGRWQI